MKLHGILIVLIASALLLAPKPVFSNAKGKPFSLPSQDILTGKITSEKLTRFERQLTPFFEMKSVNHAALTTKNLTRPTQGDLFMIARTWNQLTPAFKKMYIQSIAIPSQMKSYPSPGGNFEIFYTTTGTDSVNTLDVWGFDKNNWRNKTSGPNGIPDYIDDVAWAFDSAWSMEIDQFGFVRPLPYTENSHTSGLAKIIVENLDFIIDSQTYAQTWPTGPVDGVAIGQGSYIEFRSQWKNFTSPDYARHPEQAVHVTAAHEFFHTIQYAMTRSDGPSENNEYQLDNFPLSWLEGTAGLMENIAFDSVDDYIQYSGEFFQNPTSGTLFQNDNYSSVPYTTVLVAMYLYECLEAKPSIAFIKKMFFNNYANYIDFISNLELTSKDFNKSWADIYADFFAASYFTGNRAKTGIFLHDAPLLEKWYPKPDTLAIDYSLTKGIPSLGMNSFWIRKQDYHFSDVSINFFGDSAASANERNFRGLRCILESKSPQRDSMFSIPTTATGEAYLPSVTWSTFDDALIIASNADFLKSHEATLVFQPCPITLHAGDSMTFSSALSAILTNPSMHSVARVSVSATKDLACSLTISPAGASTMQLEKASGKNIVPENIFYSIIFPKTWGIFSKMQLTITADTMETMPIKKSGSIASQPFAIFKWVDNLGDWEKTEEILNFGAGYQWKCPLNAPGLYGVFLLDTGLKKENNIIVFPNPIRLRQDAQIKIFGKSLMEFRIYSISGALLFRAEVSMPTDMMTWPLTNSSGRLIGPGMYYALIGYKKEDDSGLLKKKQKILILP